ncbi:MAG: tRNA (adenosine(37)-N6)-threonylcarbamoyltransferase complex dimerization subunit type 1 TsaB [Acidimicrobiia bacterium]
MSNVLIIDTSTQAVEIAVGSTNEDSVTRSIEQYSSHSENIVVAIKDAIEEKKITIKDIDAIGVGVGPGLFTGLRVGIASAHSFAHALNVPLVYFSSLELTAISSVQNAAAIGSSTASEQVIVARDARRKELYFASYVFKNIGPSEVTIDSTTISTQLERVKEEQLISPKDFVDMINSQNGTYVVLDDIGKYEEFNLIKNDVREQIIEAKIDPSIFINHVTDSVMASITQNVFAPSALYIRKSDAELSWGTGKLS